MVSRFVTAALLVLALSVAADVTTRPRPRLHQRLEADEASASPAGASPLAATAPSCLNAQGQSIPCAVNLQYFGGPVLSNVKVYAVFWNGAVRLDVAQLIGGFYETLTNSEWLDWLTEYSTTLDVQAGSELGQPGTQQVIGRGTFAGNYTLPVLSTVYPACASPNQALTCVTDAEVQGELDFQIRHGNLPAPDANTLYMVHFPAGMAIELGSRPVSLSCQAFCSYHSTYRASYQDAGTQDVVYAVVPDLGNNGCQNGCGLGTPFQNTCMATSHEIAESITDSAAGLSTVVDFPLGWYDTEPTSQGEVADMCNQHSDTLGENGLPGCTSDAGCYHVQQVFSHVVWNADPTGHPITKACVTTRFDADDYALSVVPNTLTLAPGETAPPIPVVTTLTNGSAQPLTLGVTSLPTGLHASLDRESLDAGDTAQLTVSADADAAPFRDGVLVLRTTGATTHSASLLVQLATAANDWNLFLSPASAVLLSSGTSQVYTVGVQVTRGVAEEVALSSTVSGLPPGVTAILNTLTLLPGTTGTLTLTASVGAAPALPTTFSVTGTSASQPTGHSATAVVQVDTPPTVAFLSPTAGATLSGLTTVQLQATPGANASIAHLGFSVDNGPTLSDGATGTSIHWDTRAVANGSHTLLATVLDSDTASASASLTVTVSNVPSDFSLSVSPQSLLLEAGTPSHLTVTTSVVSGAAESVTFQMVGLPPGVSATFSPPSVTAGGTADVTLVASSSAASAVSAGQPSVATLTGTAPSVPLGHSVDVTLTVNAQGPSPSDGGCTASGASGRRPELLLLLAALLIRRPRR